MEQKLFADVQSLASTRSSVSLIHYFKRADDAKDAKKDIATTTTTGTTAATTTTTAATTATETKASETTSAPAQSAASCEAKEAKEKDIEKGKEERSGLDIATADDNEIEIACAEHTDTGILTLIMCAHVSGLQIADRFAKKARTPAATATTAEASMDAMEGSEDGAGFAKRQKAKDKAANSKYEYLEVERMFEPGKHLFVIAGTLITRCSCVHIVVPQGES